MTENMSAFRRVLEDLAHSRGLAGAEELAEKAVSVDPSMESPQTLLENPRGGYGNALDAVLSLSEDEKTLISAADGPGARVLAYWRPRRALRWRSWTR